MSLIDPATPEGFFHMRVGPYAEKARETEVTFFPMEPDADAESYFVPARGGTEGPQVLCDKALLNGAGVVSRLLEQWKTEPALLHEFGADLELLRQSIVSDTPPENDPEITDFVYTLF